MLITLILLLAVQELSPAEEAIHNQLRALRDTMTQALNERDLDLLVANVHQDVVFTTMNGDVCKGPDEIRAYFKKMLEGPNHIVDQVTVSFEVDELTRLYGGDMGIACGSSADHYVLSDGTELDINGRWTCTMVLDGDRWVIAAFHYSTNMFDNPVLDQTLLWTKRAVAGAAVLGLILGLLLMWFIRRKGAR